MKFFEHFIHSRKQNVHEKDWILTAAFLPWKTTETKVTSSQNLSTWVSRAFFVHSSCILRARVRAFVKWSEVFRAFQWQQSRSERDGKREG